MNTRKVSSCPLGRMNLRNHWATKDILPVRSTATRLILSCRPMFFPHGRDSPTLNSTNAQPELARGLPFNVYLTGNITGLSITRQISPAIMWGRTAGGAERPGSPAFYCSGCFCKLTSLRTCSTEEYPIQQSLTVMSK